MRRRVGADYGIAGYSFGKSLGLLTERFPLVRSIKQRGWRPV